MDSLNQLLLAYLVGGVTFIPLLLVVVFLHAYLTLPKHSKAVYPGRNDERDISRADDDGSNVKSGADILADKFTRKHESDVAAGYFAVCREYVPGGVNGKPPERTTPSSEILAAESPSVYQSMYRSIFDRQQKPTLQTGKNDGKNVKRARNVFFVVLRHGHLMLYDDAEQLEVRHVISLEHHDVSIYGGAEEIPEGELWIKRNAICLSRNKEALKANQAVSLPFFLFSENCSEKEDFYFALLKNKERISKTSSSAPLPLEYGTQDIVTLVKKLHSSEQQIQTRWLNAIIGRLFLAMYRTPELEEFVRQKMTKKISRVKKPNFITKIILQKIEMGEGAPLITNPKLKDLTVDGDCVAEADVKYTGKFRIEIAATARLDLGTRFKAREVDIVLAIVVNKLEGHGLIRFKPPPSNRIWVAFETMPDLDLKIEPIVSTRQITYNIVLRAIESRIREVFAETVVLPFWDDIPFMETTGQEHRGGIWKRAVPVPEPVEIKEENPEDLADSDQSVLEQHLSKHLEAFSEPNLTSPVPNSPVTPAGKTRTWGEEETPGTGATEKPHRAEPPRAIRSSSFQASMADPMVSPSHADSRRDSDNLANADNARNMLRELSNKNSISASPAESSTGSPPTESAITAALRAAGRRKKGSKDSNDRPSSAHTQQASETSSVHTDGQVSTTSESIGEDSQNTSNPNAPSRTATIASSVKSAASNISNPSPQSDKRTIPTISHATTVAKNWGWGVLARQQARREQQQKEQQAGGGNKPNQQSTPNKAVPTTPMGRGQPLPPPGQPLPHPHSERSLLSSIPLPKRRIQGTSPPPLHGRQLERQGSGSGNGSSSDTGTGTNNGKSRLRRPAPKRLPTPAERRSRASGRDTPGAEGEEEGEEGVEEGFSEEELLVVRAPVDSNPSSPADVEAEEQDDGDVDDEDDQEHEKGLQKRNGFGEDVDLLGKEKILHGADAGGLDDGVAAPKLPPRR